MKRLVSIFLILSLPSYFVTAQSWTPSGSDLYFTGGNVGIGFTSPSYALDVNGTGRFASSVHLGTPHSIGFEIDGTYGAHHWITYNDGGGNFNFRVGNKLVSGVHTITETGHAFHTVWTQTTGNIRWKISQNAAAGSSATFRELFNIDYDYGFVANELGDSNLNFRVEGDSETHLLFADASADRVGIGTSAPSNPLHVSKVGTDEGGFASAQEVVGRFTSTSNHSAISVDAITGQDPIVYLAEDGEAMWDIRSDQSDSDKFQIRWQNQVGTNTARLTIDNTGNIGIGTTTPGSKLQIAGSSGNWNESTQGLSKGTIHLDPENSTNHYGNALTFGASDDSGSGENAQAGIYVRTDGTYGSKLYFSTTDSYAEGSKTRMMITHTGYVGIGTTSPDEKLTVKGKIHTEEVKVDLSVPGPDYVFAEDYNLPSLEEIEAFIKSEKHLPEIPSAKEMEENGVELGTMNMLLLKKIEELTLYTIAQSKEIENLKSDNQELRITNSELSQQLITTSQQILHRIEKLENRTK